MKIQITVTVVLASAAGVANAMATSHQLCAETSFLEKGNWYCKPVQLIMYQNVGRAGSYKEVVNMNQETGECQFANKSFGGPLAPFNEPMSFHFRGPIVLKQFAVYLPNNGRYKVKRKIEKLRKRDGHDKYSSNQEFVYEYQDYLALYEHAEAEKKAFLEAEDDGHDNKPGFRRTTRHGKTKSKGDYKSGPIKHADKQGRIKKGTTLTQLPDGSVGFWETPGNDRVILQATSEEFDFLWHNVHKLTLKFPSPVPHGGAKPKTKPRPAASPESFKPESSSKYPEQGSSESHKPVDVLPAPPAPYKPSPPKPQQHKPPSKPQQHEPPKEPTTNAQQYGPPSPQPSAEEPTLPDHNPPYIPPSDDPPNLGTFARSGYYSSTPLTSHGLTFLGNYGGQGSGLWTPTFGNTLSYINSQATGGSSGPQILSPNTFLPSGKEFSIFSSLPCSSSETSSCGYIQPGSVAYQGFGSSSSETTTADKIFLVEFSMPHDSFSSDPSHFQHDMPAIWMLNAKIPYTAQYHACSCWSTGCGEFDVVEVLDPGNDKAKTTFHSVFGGVGDGNYFARPVNQSVTLAVVFDGELLAVSVKVLGKNWNGGGGEGSFPERLGEEEIRRFWTEEDLEGGGLGSAYRIL
ncbi:putative TOS1-like glycosyl hydrolase (DUF2401) domain containing protein [Rhypophila sp. PSN 637]